MNRNALLAAALLPFALFAGYRSAEALHGWARSASFPLAVDGAAPALAAGLPYASEDTAAAVDVVVNAAHPLPASYVPPDLTAPDIPFIFEGEHEKRLLRAAAAREAERLFAAAERDGVALYGVSGYRSYDTQKALFAFNVRTKGEAHAERYSAVPGASEHQTGLALDVTAESVGFRLVPAFADTAEGRWLERRAHEFGFVIRYPEGKEHITGYAYEPWHIRYVGRDAAIAAHAYGLTLEEMASGAVPVFSQ